MLSKNTFKLIHSLALKKQRKALGLFLVQGEKNVNELLNSSFEIKKIYASQGYIQKNNLQLSEENHLPYVEEASQKELEKAGTLHSNNQVLALVKCKQQPPLLVSKGLTLALDQVRDPGNLGTIIRIADWYGIDQIICSKDCADFYNPKVISASMGSFARVDLQYLNLESYLATQKRPIYGAFLEGENIHKSPLNNEAVIVMGNESNGISDEIKKMVTDRVTIPKFGLAESLNVATATAIILDNFKRR